jgi:hypothetical protein
MIGKGREGVGIEEPNQVVIEEEIEERKGGEE